MVTDRVGETNRVATHHDWHIVCCKVTSVPFLDFAHEGQMARSNSVQLPTSAEAVLPGRGKHEETDYFALETCGRRVME